MCPEQCSGRFLHGSEIKRTPYIPGIPMQEGIRRFSLNNTINIALASRTVTRTEITRCLRGFADDNILWQQAVSCTHNTVNRNRTVGKKIHDLSIGMDPCIRPAGSR